MARQRLDRIICGSGKFTRSEAKKLIRAGVVAVNGVIVTVADAAFDAEADAFSVEGAPICVSALRYLMMNKPAGVLSATEDKNQTTVMDLLPEEYSRLGLFPAGRLDKDSTGLLILTNDGKLGHELTSPRHTVPKRYEVRVEGNLTREDSAAFEAGITLADGTECLAGKLEIDAGDPAHGFATITEGRYHQVKRMLASLGKPVRSLKRVSEGALELDDNLAEGAYRELSPKEIRLIFGEM